MVDRAELKKWWDLFVGDGNFTEIRILGKFQYSGYFKDFDNLVKQLEPYTEMPDEQIYFVLNKIDDACYARPQCEKFLKSVKVSTSDSDIVSRRFVMIDCDAIRKSSVNSSEAEYQFAIQKTRDIFKFLRKNNFPDPIVCVSGNGGHLQIPVDLPNDEETTEILKSFYKYLGQEFTDEHVDIDQKVFNLARICKTYSTIAKKGANLPDRPWRQSKILYVPNEIKITPIETFKAIADLLPKEEPKPQVHNSWNGSRSSEKFDLENWLNSHGIDYRKKPEGLTTKYEIRDCPWKESHSTNNPYSSALFQDADGKITYSCAHSHCSDKQWKDFRLYYQPDAYDKPDYQPQRTSYAPRQQRQRYQIKEEMPELGEKWFQMSSIKKVDITSLEKVKTGFVELDRKIGGLYMSEVTVLSGSNASGKSSWLNSVMLNIIQQGYKVALWSGELRADILKSWIQMVAAGPYNLRQSQFDDGRYYVPDPIAERIDRWLDGKLFIYNNEYGNVASQMLNDIKILTQSGVKVFMIDNMMAANIDVFDGDKNDRQKQYILELKEFAMKEQVHVIVVAHPRKSMAFLRKNDISGTGDIINAVDNCLIFHRTNEDFLRAVAEFYNPQKANHFMQFGNVLSIEKNRLFGVVDYMCGFHYDLASRRFKNTQDENIRYGWEDEPTEMSMSFDDNKGNADYDESLPFQPPQTDGAPF